MLLTYSFKHNFCFNSRMETIVLWFKPTQQLYNPIKNIRRNYISSLCKIISSKLEQKHKCIKLFYSSKLTTLIKQSYKNCTN